MSVHSSNDPLAPGQPCLPANPIYFCEALEATLPVLQAQMELEAAGQVDWSTAQFKVMETFMQAYDPKASEIERYSALWRTMKLFELIQDSGNEIRKMAAYLVPDAVAGCLRIHPTLLAKVIQHPMQIGDKIILESNPN